MKRLSTTPISDTAQMPIKKGTLEFLQDAHKECTDALCKTLIGVSYSSSIAYVLNGCVNAGTGDNYIISAGSVFYNGEIYLVDATTFTATSPNVPVLTIVTTQFITDADPVIFTDSTSRNVHNIRKIIIASGASGSGIANYSDCSFVNAGQNIFTVKYPVTWDMDTIEQNIWTLQLPLYLQQLTCDQVANKVVDVKVFIKYYGSTTTSVDYISINDAGSGTIDNYSIIRQNGIKNEINIAATRTTGGQFDNSNYTAANVNILVTFDNSL